MKKIWRQLSAAGLAFALILNMLPNLYAKAAPAERLDQLAENIAESYAYTSDPWRIVDLVSHRGRADARINKSAFYAYAAELIAQEQAPLSSLAVTALAFAAVGDDPRALTLNGGSVDLLGRLLDRAALQAEERAVDLYSASVVLYSLAAAGQPEAGAGLLKEFLSAQYVDGGWGFDGENSDVDMTAMFLAALAPYRAQAKISESIERGLAYLQQTQTQNGGFSSWGTENANSTAMVLIALTALGVDGASDARFIKNGNSVVDALLSFATQEKDGFGFTDRSYNAYATEQGFRALGSYLRFLKAGRPQSGCAPYWLAYDQENVADGAARDANASQIAIEGAGLTPAFDPAVKTYALSVAAGAVRVRADAAAEGAVASVGGASSDELVSLQMGENVVSVAVVSPDRSQTKEYRLYITRSGEEIPEDRAVRLSVIGLDGQVLLPVRDVRIRQGDTPYRVLLREAEESGLEVATQGSGSAVYVSRIEDLEEMGHGPSSGWMYAVNGTYYRKSADALILKPGDALQWAYTRDGGADIGDEPQAEEDYADAAEIAPWAREAVQQARESGILLGSGDCFHPKKALTRAELAQIIVRALGIKAPEEARSFNDVPSGAWYAAAVNTAASSGLMQGTGEGRFAPDRAVTREEMAVLLARVSSSEAADGIEPLDFERVSPWAQAAVRKVCVQGLMNGDAQGFHPQDRVTREMAAVILIRLQAAGVKFIQAA